MQNVPRQKARERGSALVAVMILGLITLLTAAAVFEYAARDAALAADSVSRSKALYLAEAGLARAQTWLEAQDDPPPGVLGILPFGSAPDTLAGGTYFVTIQPDPSNPYFSRKYYTITSTGTAGGKTRTLEQEVMTQSFAQFIYFTEEEHMPGSYAPIWFCSADHIDGALHTNGQIHIMGDPWFAGHVSSAYGGPDDDDPSHEPLFMYYNGSFWTHKESAEPSNPPYDEPTFGDGYELGMTAIDLPECVDDLEAMAEEGGLHLSGDLRVELSRRLPDGSRLYGYVSYKPISDFTWVDVPISSFNGIVFVNGDVQIAGILDGNLTVACSNNMYIMNDVVYRDADPVDGPNEGCDDMLGLVSEQNIVVKNTRPNRHDCNIHAHMMALDTSFYAENYSSGTPRGTLTVHGGIIQRYRGAVGTGYLDGDQVIIRSGYAKNYHYDSRFDSLQPPGYFLTGKYFPLSWREVT